MKSEIIGTVAALALATLCTVSVNAQGAADASGPPVLAKQLAPARGTAKITVTSGAFSSGAHIPDENTQNGANKSPPLEWSRGPLGTRSYVVLAEDSGVDRKEPIVHWVVYDVSPAITRLVTGVPSDAKLEFASQGKNITGKAGYIGPKPPAGETHPYHFEVFALNAKLNLDPANTDRDAVVAAMKDKVLASGDLVGNYTGK
jgi:Raf kinase inhibitor-like YbhB/YbcL family protein